MLGVPCITIWFIFTKWASFLIQWFITWLMTVFKSLAQEPWLYFNTGRKYYHFYLHLTLWNWNGSISDSISTQKINTGLVVSSSVDSGAAFSIQVPMVNSAFHLFKVKKLVPVNLGFLFLGSFSPWWLRGHKAGERYP